MGESLFRRLTAAHPSAAVALTRQFRMCGPIMELSNRLTYGGALRAGSATVADARLTLPGLSMVRWHRYQ
jgi:DNA replication ATP-dependent helicase Dna2